MRIFALAAVLLVLSSCATAFQPRDEAIEITSVNGVDPKCTLSTPLYKTVAYPPQTVNVERSRYVLVVDCFANDGKHRRLLVQPEHNPTSTYFQPLSGMAVDRITGSAWQYPPYMRIDFDYAPFTDPMHPDGSPPATTQWSTGVPAAKLNPQGGVND